MKQEIIMTQEMADLGSKIIDLSENTKVTAEEFIYILNMVVETLRLAIQITSTKERMDH